MSHLHNQCAHKCHNDMMPKKTRKFTIAYNLDVKIVEE